MKRELDPEPGRLLAIGWTPLRPGRSEDIVFTIDMGAVNGVSTRACEGECVPRCPLPGRL
ncbi:hypothetical protein AVL59_22425 [Streptomyces griseochromogenes]|uniref:Uncharacterized protein n=1 Tax=Streptomyces griseochromogenes TaxID=68214 RepID=A0A1B1AZG7_9ACTN|nr:hypothetical protein AVL59_22425 [Streptomyces griseochromogenes]